MSKKTQDYKISLFTDTFSTKQTQIKVNDYFKGIIEGKWQDEVFSYRNGKLDKKKLKAVTASGLFSGRKDSDLIEHTGLLVIDIDNKDQNIPTPDIKNALKEIPELYACHYSLSGEGIAAYFRIKRDKHRESYDAIAKMLVNDYGVICDLHCSNIGRLRFVSYDPECHLNYGASIWNFFESKENKVKEQDFNMPFSGNDIDYILTQIKERQLNIAPDYYSWLRIGFALADHLGAGGKDAFKLISSFYYGKQKTDPGKQFDRCLAAKGRGISIKSFFHFAKLAGCNLTSDRTKKISTIGRIRRKQEGIGDGKLVNGKADAKQYLLEYEGITGSDVDDILKQLWDQPIKDLVPDEGVIYDIEVFLKSNYKMKLNEITNIVEVDGEPLNDYLFNSIYLRCSKVVDKANKDKVFDLIHSDFTPKYNPILEWIEKHKKLKPSGNVEALANCIESNLTYKDKTFVKDYLEKWLISIIASAHGIYSILCFVLTGQTQGTGKTNFFRELLPEDLRWLFAINKLDGKEADVGQLMCSKLLILDDEFGGKSKQDEKKFKELISKDVFSIRKPYGRYFEDMQRLAVLCGTTNEEQIINDLTGNRRIIPVQVNYIDEKKFNDIDKDELFMELYWLFRNNNKGWFFTREDIERLNDVCFDANQVAAEMELPIKYFGKAQCFDAGAKFYSSSEIRSAIEQRSGLRISQQKLSIALKRLGFNYEQRSIDGTRCRGFWLVDKAWDNKPDTEIEENTGKDKADGLPF